ncbi:hypothetical protein JOF56_007100 [Kibdelosporangium banguiense]|uniref:Uncharacterized protein n=1 Tax=Kibdelosporangium banguiense TaxID=1365924 RepID=A0ABS4TQN0_9PSEU|nr:hypothetical protein [Kibdelosporangium banguiense]MBP2326715.1 hypothetical protein [Kibdelosporangium banguiense]
MDDRVWAELRSLLRTIRLAGAVPRIVTGANRKATGFIHAFEHTVQPIVNETINNPQERTRVAQSLLSYSTKTSFVIAGYARMTGVPFASDIAVLGLSFTRLYDDLFDETDDEDLPQRLMDLFDRNMFIPASDPERLLHRLYEEIDRRLGRDRDDPIYTAVSTMHRYQIQARCQRDPQTTDLTLAEVTRGKGGHGTLAVFALMRAGLHQRERDLILEIGEALQLLDDYMDIDEDRLHNTRTLATEGRLALPDVCRRLRAAQHRLVAYYGRRNTREFLGICYVTLWMCFLRRQWPQIEPTVHPRSTWDLVIRPGDNAVSRPGQPSPSTPDNATNQKSSPGLLKNRPATRGH